MKVVSAFYLSVCFALLNLPLYSFLTLYILFCLRTLIVNLVFHLINRKFLSLLSVAAFFVSLSSTVSAYGQSPEEIIQRISPIGKVCIAGEECEVVAAVASSGSGGARDGESVYGTFCIACHSIGVAGAPKFGSASDWAPRLDKGMDTLLSNAINGINAMPARGTCADCSDDEIQMSIDYMLSNNK